MTRIEYIQDNDQISPRHRTNISRTHNEYLQDTHQISPDHTPNFT